jgi:SAM-dependent methyltransferase
LLDHAARYFPILRVLRQHNLLAGASILEIGSGAVGLGEFHKSEFVGCDVSFSMRPLPPMTPLMASAGALPFANRAFDVVVASDVLEHVPPAARPRVIQEALRVGRKLVVFGFPCGQLAHDADTKLLAIYLQKKFEVPVWLAEHMQAPFPEPDVFHNLQGWGIDSFGNESIDFHLRIWKHLELQKVLYYSSRACFLIAPRLLEYLLRKTDRAPYYRRIFVLKRQDTT